MSDPVQDMTDALVSALHDQLRAARVPINVAQITDAVNMALGVVQYPSLVATITAANVLTAAVAGDYPAPLAATAAALGDYGLAKADLGGPNHEIP